MKLIISNGLTIVVIFALLVIATTMQEFPAQINSIQHLTYNMNMTSENKFNGIALFAEGITH
jgi:hypothetical protein